ncbi:MAG: dihydrofolate reductase family protein [Microthrixaceae bacterium]
MRQLLPREISEVDLTEIEGQAGRTAPAQRPWVMANMVTSIDGAYAVDRRSGGLGTPGDRRLFHHLRQGADAILVTAGTARKERYRRPHMDPEVVRRRRDRGQADHPLLVVVSRSLSFPGDLPMLTGEGETPMVLHPRSASATGLPPALEARAVGELEVDMGEALKMLRDSGVERVLCEGGPNLLGQLHRADLIDEMFLTVSPSMVGGHDVGILGRTEPLQRRMELHRLMEEDGALFLTYRRAG